MAMRALGLWLVPVVAMAAPDGQSAALAPDIVVAQDGSGQFNSVQAAIDSVPVGNTERLVILVRAGVYEEQVLIHNRSCLTILGEGPERTAIVADIPYPDWSEGRLPGAIGRSTVNLGVARDTILDGLTIANSAATTAHTFALDDTHSLSEGVARATDRIIVQNCRVTANGLDTLSLWQHGDYYLRNVQVSGAGHHLGIRGTAHVRGSTITSHGRRTVSLFHDGHVSPDEKLVLRDCRFTGEGPYGLGSFFTEAAFYFCDCLFSSRLQADLPIFRSQRRPDGSYEMVTEGLHVYFSGSRGPDYPWLADNLAEAAGAPPAAQVTAAWTFGGRWDPERRDPPRIVDLSRAGAAVSLAFSESVTVKGSPRLVLADGGRAEYAGGSGAAILRFRVPRRTDAEVVRVEMGGAAIIGSMATARTRHAEEALHR